MVWYCVIRCDTFWDMNELQHAEQKAPVSARFPADLRAEVTAYAASTDRTFSSALVHLVRVGLKRTHEDAR